jgi:hypothetical protein
VFVCACEAYLLELVRSIHLKPARLRNPLDPWKYEGATNWLILAKGRVRIETDAVLGQWAKTAGQARGTDLRFMERVSFSTLRMVEPLLFASIKEKINDLARV